MRHLLAVEDVPYAFHDSGDGDSKEDARMLGQYTMEVGGYECRNRTTSRAGLWLELSPSL